jgi:hypothetical protein
MRVVLAYVLKKFNFIIPQKMNYEIKGPISKISYLNDFNYLEHESIMEALNDERCMTIDFERYFQNEEKTKYLNHSIFLTPHFYNQFEFTRHQKICDHRLLRAKMKYAANQLGFQIRKQNIK